MIKILAAVTKAGDGLNLIQEDACSVELMTAEFGHQSTARIVIQPPIHQAFHGRIPEFARQELVEIFDPLLFREVLQAINILFEFLAERFGGVATWSPAIAAGKAIIAMPLGANELQFT